MAGVVEEVLHVAEQRAELARAEHLRRRLEALPDGPERAELERHYANALLAAAALRALGKETR